VNFRHAEETGWLGYNFLFSIIFHRFVSLHGHSSCRAGALTGPLRTFPQVYRALQSGAFGHFQLDMNLAGFDMSSV
jgi:hypothetical protein